MQMRTFETNIYVINDLPIRVAQAHGGDATPVVFLHGGSPGVTPYCAGWHIWGDVLDDFARSSRVLAPDLPGSGATPLPAGKPPTLEMMSDYVLGLMEHLGLPPAHLVGHAESGLLALWMAHVAPEKVASVSMIASPSAAPSGDSLPVMTLDHPPQPLWSRLSQRWTFDQVSWSHAHIDDVLLNACVAAAGESPHRDLVRNVALESSYRVAMTQSVGRIKSKFFQIYREQGLSVPIQLVWGSDDPLSGIDRGFGLFRMIARKQPMAAFDVINRTGHFPFREDPEAFFDIVSAFQEAVGVRASKVVAA